MTPADWAVGALVTFFLVVCVAVFRAAFGIGDRRRDRAELKRAARRAEPERE